MSASQLVVHIFWIILSQIQNSKFN